MKLDKWYGVLLYLGVLLVASSFYFKIDFVEEKNLFGLGIGMIIIGIAYWMSEKYLNQFVSGGILEAKINKHSPISVVLIIIGIGLIGLFLFKIIKELI